MLTAEQKKKIMDAQAGSPIMSENVKVQQDDLIERELTIQDYNKVGSDTGDKHHYFAVTFEELPGNYILSGSALTKIIDAAEADGGDIRGEKIKFEKKIKLDGGKSYTPCVLL